MVENRLRIIHALFQRRKCVTDQGATLWNAYKDGIMKDEFGIDSARKLGIRVAETALKLSK